MLAVVGPDDLEQRGKVRARAAAGHELRAEPELCAPLVPLDAIFHFVRVFGGGDSAAAWVAGRQLEIITAAQLGAAGVSKDGILTRRRRGTLHRVHRGVYLFGSPMMLPGARELAAVLACGEGSVISHRSAAVLWGLAPGSTLGAAAPGSTLGAPAPGSTLGAAAVGTRAAPAWGARVDVTVVGRGRTHNGLQLHRVVQLDAADRDTKDGIPVTAVARTMLDYASRATSYELERAIAEAYALDLVTEAELRAAIRRAPRRPGAAALRAELDREGGPVWTQSEGERQMLRLLRAARLPLPETQLRIAGWPADFAWPEARLLVEVDGYKFHGSRRAFERDRRRDQAHVAAGWRVIRVTWRQIEQEPLAVATSIALALGGYVEGAALARRAHH